jgi:curli biogenesis system outer membrane secretion channel CsgG
MTKKMIAVFLIAVLLLTIALPISRVGAAEKLPKIAILPFDDGSIKDRWWGNHFDLGKGVGDELVTALLNLTPKAFRLIEREQVEKVIQEQDFGASGRVDTRTAAKIGKILGVQYLVIGRVTEFSNKSSNGGLNLGGKSLGVKSTKSIVAIDARLVDTTTAEIIASVTGRGEKNQTGLSVSVDYNSIDLGSNEFKETNLGIALRDATNQVAKGLAEKVKGGAVKEGPIEGSVAYASEDKVIINVGAGEGVQVDMVFVVERVIEEVKDPDTGEVLDTVVEKIAEIKVAEVKEKSSTCTIIKKISTKHNIAVKDKVRQKMAK